MSESPDALRAALRELEERIRTLDETREARARTARALAETRDARRIDRERAIASLDLRPRRVAVCAGATGAGAVRPKRCPGCGVAVVDPRGLDRAQIARRLGTEGGWLARSDGLLAATECAPLVRARALRRDLARMMLVSGLVGFALGRLVTLAS